MIPSDRVQQILNLIEIHGTLTNAKLAATLNVSLMTVRRDIIELELRGLIRRVHGGIETVSAPDRGFSLRSRQQQTAKQAIAKAAAALVSDFETIYLDSGSTAFELALCLRQRELKNLRVVTHATNIASELAGLAHISVIQIGGEILGQTFSALGPLALTAIATLRFDCFYMSCQGFSLESGVTDSHLLEADLKKAVIEASGKVCLIADASKWQRVSFVQVAPLTRLTLLMTNSSFPQADRALLADAQVPVRFV
jgi:DeoR/GlpR family transcriptional regulator of sugar metabolism